LYAGLVAGRLAGACALPDIIRTARSRPSRTQSPPTVADLLTDGLVARLTDQHRIAVPILRRAVAGLLVDESPTYPLLAVGTWAAGEIMDSKAQQAIAERWVHSIGDRTAGSPPLIASSLPSQSDISGSSDLLTLAWSGREAETRSAAARHVRQSIERGHGLGITFSDYALVILELGLSHYEAALTYALNVYRDDPPDLGTHVLPDLVEAAARSGCQDIARVALDRLSDRASASGTPLASGLLARSRALLADNATAEGLYREAMDHLRRSGAAVHVARAHLVCGEWLRRRRRRRDAREHLRTARDMFDAMGASAFARRTSAELQATNETLGEAAGLLTPQEMQVARLVREGFANREVAAQLFISLNTVEYHLQKVYRKLGVSSRTQLARTLLDQGQGDQPPVR
jgi:DNA-binding CsgD family transcriptional regulator